MLTDKNKWLVQWALLGRPSVVNAAMFISIPEVAFFTSSPSGFYCPDVQLTVWCAQRVFNLYDWNVPPLNGKTTFCFSSYDSLMNELSARLVDR